MRKKSFKLKNVQLLSKAKGSLLKKTNSFSEIKTQVKGNTVIITKFAAQLLLLIFLIGLIIYSLPS